MTSRFDRDIEFAGGQVIELAADNTTGSVVEEGDVIHCNCGQPMVLVQHPGCQELRCTPCLFGVSFYLKIKTFSELHEYFELFTFNDLI